MDDHPPALAPDHPLPDAGVRLAGDWTQPFSLPGCDAPEAREAAARCLPIVERRRILETECEANLVDDAARRVAQELGVSPLVFELSGEAARVRDAVLTAISPEGRAVYEKRRRDERDAHQAFEASPFGRRVFMFSRALARRTSVRRSVAAAARGTTRAFRSTPKRRAAGTRRTASATASPSGSLDDGEPPARRNSHHGLNPAHARRGVRMVATGPGTFASRRELHAHARLFEAVTS